MRRGHVSYSRTQSKFRPLIQPAAYRDHKAIGWDGLSSWFTTALSKATVPIRSTTLPAFSSFTRKSGLPTLHQKRHIPPTVSTGWYLSGKIRLPPPPEPDFDFDSGPPARAWAAIPSYGCDDAAVDKLPFSFTARSGDAIFLMSMAKATGSWAVIFLHAI
jgi:hypothetical protein